MDQGRRQTGKLLLTGKLRLESPLLVGGDELDSGVDRPVLRDGQGQPYIPGTSLCGVLRHYCRDYMTVDGLSQEASDWFWGSVRKPKDSKALFIQSSLIISDARLDENEQDKCRIEVRDGVAITSHGIAEDSKKYDYEVIEPGAVFAFQAEITLFEKYKEDFKQAAFFILNRLEAGEISIGAMTTKGLGRCRLTEIAYWEYNFRDKRDVWNWLAGMKEERPKPEITADTAQKVSRDFKLTAVFEITNSLLIKAYATDSDQADSMHIKSNNRNILPGTSVKGALRSRMQRILNTLGCANPKMLDDLCGMADKNTGQKRKSRLILEETEIHQVAEEDQTRIKIDRFTGGVMDGALYSAKALWPDAEKQSRVELKATIKDCHPGEAGLLLLVVKDLWCGDLALGGEKSIGRGVLKGISAEIEFDGEKYSIMETGEGLKISGGAEKLEKLVHALFQECGKEALP